MKHALLAAVACVAVAASASATSSGNMAGKLNTRMNAQNTNDSAVAQPRTVDTVVAEACARGETVTETVTRTVPRFFAGRMVPHKVEMEKTVCN